MYARAPEEISFTVTASEVLGRASITLPAGIGPLLVVGGMVVGVAGSLISLGRLRV